MNRGQLPAGTDRSQEMGEPSPGIARLALAALTACLGASPVVGDAGPKSAPEWRLTAAMEEVVHVDVPFTLRVRLWNPSTHDAQVLIRHHREEELPFKGWFSRLSESGSYWWVLVRGEDKKFVIRGWYVRCGPETPPSDCPPLRNVYHVTGGGYAEFAEVVTLRDYTDELLDGPEGGGFVAGPHRLLVTLSFVESPEPYMLDVRNPINRPFTHLETEVDFVLETDAFSPK